MAQSFAFRVYSPEVIKENIVYCVLAQIVEKERALWAVQPLLRAISRLKAEKRHQLFWAERLPHFRWHMKDSEGRTENTNILWAH